MDGREECSLCHHRQESARVAKCMSGDFDHSQLDCRQAMARKREREAETMAGEIGS